jgi:hypothetical protein
MSLMEFGNEMFTPLSWTTKWGYVGAHRTRSYQLEMLERSLKENVIVAVR